MLNIKLVNKFLCKTLRSYAKISSRQAKQIIKVSSIVTEGINLGLKYRLSCGYQLALDF